MQIKLHKTSHALKQYELMMMIRKWKTMMAMIDALMLGNKTKTREKGFPEGLIILSLRKTTRDDDDDIADRGIDHT